MVSAAHQTFAVGGPTTAISTITISDDPSAATIDAANDIRIRIPTGFNMSWDTGDLSATIGGSAVGKVSGTVSYEDGGQTLVVNVTSDFTAGDVVTIADLSFTGFTADSPVDSLELVIRGAGAGVASFDDKTIAIGVPTISSAANQTFIEGDPATVAGTITITDGAVTPTIQKKNEIRIRIPTGFNMTWNPAILSFGVKDLPAIGTQADAPTSEATKGENYQIPRGLTLTDAEKEYISRVMADCDGSVQRAAEILGISRKNLWEKRKKYQLLD